MNAKLSFRRRSPFRPSYLMVALHVYLGTMALVLISGGISWFLQGGDPDFKHIYAQTQLVLRGQKNQFYDIKAQQRIQFELFGNRLYGGTVMPYIHPPFEIFLYLPFGYLSYTKARVLWTIVNLGLILLLPLMLTRKLYSDPCVRKSTIYLGTLSFCPFLVALWQGQTSLIALWCLLFVFVRLKQEKDFSAGIFLSCAFVRYHLAYLFVPLFLLKGKTKSLLGFALSAGFLTGVSALWLGMSGMVKYVQLVLTMNASHGTNLVQPGKMANWSGFVYTLGITGVHSTIGALVMVCGALVFLGVIWRREWNPKGNDFELRFSATVLLSLCATPYLYMHDLSLAFIPLALCYGYLNGFAGPKGLKLAFSALLIISPIVWLYPTELTKDITIQWAMVWMTTLLLISWLILHRVPSRFVMSPVQNPDVN